MLLYFMLAYRDAFRTFDWQEAIGDPLVILKQINELLVIVK